MQISKFFNSKTFQVITWGVAILILIFISFSAGVRVGFEKASHTFERRGISPRLMPHGSGTPSMFMERGELGETRGLSGIISSATGTEVTVEDRNGEDRAVSISPETKIRSGGDEIKVTDLKQGDFIVVFGETNSDEQIVPKLIRVLPKMDTINNK